jgi:predicted nucleic acid-binding protein
MHELSRVLDYTHIKKLLLFNKQNYIDFILSLSTYIKAESFNVHSPDKDDDYLYDIALTAHAKLLVTGEKALLSWTEAPVETINLAQFKNLF